MILHLEGNIPQQLLSSVSERLDARYVVTPRHVVFVTKSDVKSVPPELAPYAMQVWNFDSDIQLASRKYCPQGRQVKVGNSTIGAGTNNMLMIAGPCAVESREQIEASGEFLASLGLHTLRAGCFKPRTSPYTFRGLGAEGLDLLCRMREKYGHTIVTEARDASNVELVAEKTDVIQIGTKSMFDYTLLTACGNTDKPILLKRNYGATLREFVQCAEFIMSCGNENVILCERGIRSFENATRFTLDLCGVAWLKQHCSLPIVVDPSHAMGVAYGIPDLARACTAMGVDGLLIETHPNPQEALSDAKQQLAHDEFERMYESLKKVAEAVGRNIV